MPVLLQLNEVSGDRAQLRWTFATALKRLQDVAADSLHLPVIESPRKYAALSFDGPFAYRFVYQEMEQRIIRCRYCATKTRLFRIYCLFVSQIVSLVQEVIGKRRSLPKLPRAELPAPTRCGSCDTGEGP